MRGMPQAGDLRDRIAIGRLSDAPGAAAGIDRAYTTVDTVWARVEPVGGALHVNSVQVEAPITHRVTLRYRADLTNRHVFEFDGWRYRIRRIKHLDGRKLFTEAECEQETPP